MAEKTFERTPKDLIIGIAMTLCGGVLWGVNATVSKILMGTYHASPLWIACVRELAAGVLFLTCSAIMTPKLLTGALRDRKSYPRLLPPPSYACCWCRSPTSNRSTGPTPAPRPCCKA